MGLADVLQRLQQTVFEYATTDFRDPLIRFRKARAEPTEDVRVNPNTDPLTLYDPNSTEDLEKRLQLRELFRDEQLFEQLLPRSLPYEERHLTARRDLATYVDHWSEPTMFVPMDHSRVIFGSVTSALMVTTIATPFDVVKNYWICSPKFIGVRYRVTTKEVIRSLYEKAGLRGFYSGFGAALGVTIPQNLIFFGCYERFRTENPAVVAALRARVIAATITLPMEYIRTRLQANPGEFSFLQLTRRLHSFEWGRVYVRGFGCTLLRDVPFSALYWALNEKLKVAIADRDPEFTSRSNFRSNFVYPFAAGSSAAAIASTLTHPLDVLKTTIQGMDPVIRRRGAIYRVYTDVFVAASQIYRELGWRGFYVGLIPRLTKIIPSCGILLGTYDYTKTFMVAPEDDFDYERY